MILAYSSKN